MGNDGFNRKVKIATMHGDIHTPETGIIKKILSPSVTSGIEVFISDDNAFLKILCKGQTILVPTVQVTHLVLK